MTIRGDVMNLSVIDDIAIQGGGNVNQLGGGISADYLERLILECADARIAAGDMRAGMALERVAREVAADWPRIETLESELESAREAGSDSGWECAADEFGKTIEDAAALLEEWAPDTVHSDLARRSRAWLRNRHK